MSPTLRFSSDYHIAHLVDLTYELRNAVEIVRIACDDTHAVA